MAGVLGRRRLLGHRVGSACLPRPPQPRTLSKEIPTPSWRAWAASACAAPIATALDGRGVRGPDITQVWNSGRTDEGLFKTIRSGVPSSEMPAFAAPRTSDRDVWQMLAYLKTLAAPAPAEPPRGNAENGAKVFRTLCVGLSQGRIAPAAASVPICRASARRARATCWWRASAAARRIFAPASSR